jgi:predicted ATP-dependent protease
VVLSFLPWKGSLGQRVSVAAIYEVLAPEEKAEAKENKKQTQFIKGKKGTQGVGNFPTPKKGRVRKNIAKVVGKSDRTLEKIVAIAEAAKKQPKKFGHILKQVDTAKRSIESAYALVKEAERQSRNNDALAETSAKLPENVTVFQGDFRRLKVIKRESCNES